MTKLSIITINYNNAEGLQKTIASIAEQTDKNFEYIVIDGNSSDGSQKVIDQFASTVSESVSEPDKGIYNAMNKGIHKATGEYLLFLNSGDTLYDRNVIKTIMPKLIGYDIVAGTINEVGTTQMLVKNPEKLAFRHLYQYSIHHPSTFIRCDAFRDVGLYDEHLKIVADWKWFLLAITKFGKTYRQIDDVIATFYSDGISSNPENRHKLISERRKVLSEEFPLFMDDYDHLIDIEEDALNFRKLKNSGWIKLGRSIGLMKNVKF